MAPKSCRAGTEYRGALTHRLKIAVPDDAFFGRKIDQDEGPVGDGCDARDHRALQFQNDRPCCDVSQSEPGMRHGAFLHRSLAASLRLYRRDVNLLMSILWGENAVPRSAEPTRKRILEAAYRLFRRQGYGRVTMDEIAAVAKLTKRTLYHHFQSKDRLLADVLEAQHDLALQAFRTFGDKLSGAPEAIVAGMFRELAVWADKPR